MKNQTQIMEPQGSKADETPYEIADAEKTLREANERIGMFLAIVAIEQGAEACAKAIHTFQEYGVKVI